MKDDDFVSKKIDDFIKSGEEGDKDFLNFWFDDMANAFIDSAISGRKRMRLVKSTRAKIDAIKEWVEENGPIWLRKALYVCVTKGLISSTSKGNYDTLGRILRDVRQDYPELLPYSLFQDKKMQQTGVGIETEIQDFDDMFEYMKENYANYRDAKTLQKYYVELFTEKDLPRPVENFLNDYEIGRNSSKGYAGDVAMFYMGERFSYIKSSFELQPILLCLSDYDAEGEHLFEKIKERMERRGVIVEKIGLTKEQIIRFDLMANQEYRDKMSKPATVRKHLKKQYVREFFENNRDLAPDGICQYELEAMETKDLLEIIKCNVCTYVDKSIIDNQREIFDAEVREWIKKHYRD